MDTSDFDRALASHHLAGFWTARVPVHVPEPAFLWPWADVHAALTEASVRIGLELAERRAIKLVNPNLPSKATSRTLQFNFSIVKGGEVAVAHRHSIAAIRFVVQGHGAWTTVEGLRCDMAPGDLILTPAGTWHDHTNASGEPAIWLDGLDGPLLQALNGALFEGHPERSQPVQGVAGPELHVPWSRARAEVAAIPPAAEDPHDGARLAYPALPTLACGLSLLRPGRITVRRRRMCACLYHVAEGSGRTQVGDRLIEWSRGDTFTVPLWQWHHHENTSGADAVLFSMNDVPLMRSLQLFRQESA